MRNHGAASAAPTQEDDALACRLRMIVDWPVEPRAVPRSTGTGIGTAKRHVELCSDVSWIWMISRASTIRMDTTWRQRLADDCGRLKASTRARTQSAATAGERILVLLTELQTNETSFSRGEAHHGDSRTM